MQNTVQRKHTDGTYKKLTDLPVRCMSHTLTGRAFVCQQMPSLKGVPLKSPYERQVKI